MSLHVAINENDQKQGNTLAPITLTEYGDYECPHCGRLYFVVKKLQRHFGDNLLFVFRNFPLTEIHPNALTAAQVAESAALQNKFWPVHDLIFENQDDLSFPYLLHYVRAVGADVEQLQKDLASARVQNKVQNDIESGARSGVNGTPTFFINGERYDGYYDYEIMKQVLEELL